MEKFTKEYAEKLADGYAKEVCGAYYDDLILKDYGSDVSMGETSSGDFYSGYIKAIEETNVKELYEALKIAEFQLNATIKEYPSSSENALIFIKEALNKLNHAS